MRILQIAPPWIDIPPTGYGGTETVISILTEKLAELGHKVTLFATGKSKTAGELKYLYQESLYSKRVQWEAGLPVLLHYHKAFELARKQKFDLVHAHLSSQTDLILLPLLSSLNMPVVATLHSPFPLDIWSNSDNRFIAEYGRSVPIVNISKFMDDTTPDGIHSMGVVYNSVPLEQYQFSESGGDNLVWIGKILPNKGLHEAIRLAKTVGRRLLFAGLIDQQSTVSLEYFKNKIKPQIDQKQIIFLGEADVELKNKMLANAEAFVNPIQWDEPFGLVMAESQAVGTPVLTYNRGAALEIVKHKETGFVAENFDELVRGVAVASKLSRRAARAHVEQNFSPEHMTADRKSVV